MKRINDFIEKNIVKVIVIFLFAGPFLDLVTSILINFLDINLTIGIMIRGLFLAFILYYSIFITKSKNKKQINIIIGIVLTYMLIHSTYTFLNKELFMTEAQNIIRIFYFPLLMLGLFNVFTDKREEVNYSKYFFYIFMTYLLLVLIPNVFNIGLDSYEIAKVGSIGLFNSANEVGAILAILLPFTIHELLKLKNIILKILIIFSIGYVFLTIGTKAPLIALVLVIMFFIIKYIIECIKKKETKKIAIISTLFVVAITASVLIFPKTSFYQNIRIHLDYLEIDNISEVITDFHVIDHFIFSERLSFLEAEMNNYKEANAIEKFIGIGSATNTERKNVEIDIFDIFFSIGIIGLIVYIIPIGYAFKKTTNTKKVDSIWLCSFILIILFAMLTGHILVKPSVSIFAVIIMLELFKYKDKRVF